MTIEISNERLIAVRDVPRQLPPRPSGRRVHVSAVYRWLTQGVRGIVLESIKIGGTTYTSAEALQRFADQLSQPERPPMATTTPPPASRQKQIEAATREVESILGTSRTRRRSG